MEKYDSLNDTIKHIDNVKFKLNLFIDLLKNRGKTHDFSKMQKFEKETFDEYTPKLKNVTYGSDEYKEYLKEMNVALKHHYQHNSHHPECFENGIDGMTLVDLIEMICDWKAASERHNDGNIYKSLEINKKRFNISDQLYSILSNTVKKYLND